MAMRFNNLNLASKKEHGFTKEDVKSSELVKSKEKMDYAAGFEKVSALGQEVNNTESENTAFNFKFIPRDKIVYNPKNDFKMVDIDKLAVDLLEDGVQHNLGAVYDPETDRYVLETGERRLRACDSLFEKYHVLTDSDELTEEEAANYNLYKVHIAPFYETGFPVNVKKAKYQDDDSEHQKLDEIDSELRKYRANIDVREFTPQERAGYIQKIRTLLEERKKICFGEEAAKITQAEVAEAVGTSERQLRKYEALDNLIPALKTEFEAGNISINKVPGIAALPEEEQMVFLDLLQKGKAVDPEKVRMYKEQSEASELARIEIEAEKDRLEQELEQIKQKSAEQIAVITEEAQTREASIRSEIEQAAKEQNEALIQKLQDDLEMEKKNSERLIAESNKKVSEVQTELANARDKINKLTVNEGNMEQAVESKAEVKAQISMMAVTADRFFKALKNYKETSGDMNEEMVVKMIKDHKELVRLANLISKSK